MLWLVKANGEIKTMIDNTWQNTQLTEPLTSQNYLDYGFDITIVTEEQWNQLGIDNFEILCWTTDTNDINLIANTNPFKPLDEIQKEPFEVLVYSDNPYIETIKLELTVPEYKPIELLTDPEIITWTDSDTPLSIEFTGKKDIIQTFDNPKILAYNTNNISPDVDVSGNPNAGYYKYKTIIDDATTPDNPDLILKNETNWITNDTNDVVTVPAGFVNKINPYKIDVNVRQFDDTDIIGTGQVLLYNQSPIFILAVVSYNTLSATIDDPNGDLIRYKILLNNKQVYPYTGEWSEYQVSPCAILHDFQTSDIILGQINTCTIIVQDEFGVQSTHNVTFLGEYSGLLFADENYNYYSADVNTILRRLNFGIIIAGLESDIAKVKLINRNYYAVKNIVLSLNKTNIPYGTDVKISQKGGTDFYGQDTLTYNTVLNSNEEIEFFVRVYSDVESFGQGVFDINVLAEVVE